jgi:hypothetical protein
VSGPTPVVLGTATVDETDAYGMAAVLTLRMPTVGIRRIEAAYGGNATYAPVASNVVEVTVSADTTVNASGVGVSYATFYPYKDGYRDTVAIRGTPGEPVSVTITIKNSLKKKVRAWSLPTRTAAWSVAWNGKTAAGTKLPAGKYTVIQGVRDRLGHVRSWTSYVTISTKRLYWYSSSITKYADTGTFAWDGTYAGGYYSNRYARGVILDGGSCEYDWEYDEEVCDVAVGAHRFTLPAATSYAGIKLSVLGHSLSGWGNGYMGIDNYASDQFDVVRTVGYSFTWYTSAGVGPTGHVNGSRVVTGIVWAHGGNEGVVEYQKVKLSFRYALLK